jgi:hypothetical protein
VAFGKLDVSLHNLLRVHAMVCFDASESESFQSQDQVQHPFIFPWMSNRRYASGGYDCFHGFVWRDVLSLDVMRRAARQKLVESFACIFGTAGSDDRLSEMHLSDPTAPGELLNQLHRYENAFSIHLFHATNCVNGAKVSLSLQQI